MPPTPPRQPHLVIDIRMATSSGIGTYIRNVVPAVVRQRSAWRFTLLGLQRDVRAVRCDALPNVGHRQLQSAIYSGREQLELALRAPAADLFWSPHYNIPLLRRGRLLVTVHDVFHLAMPEFTRGLHRRLYALGMFAAVRRSAAAVLTNSQFTRDEFERYVGSVRGGIFPALLGVSDEWRRPVTPRTEADARPYVVFVGNVKPHKNLVTLLRALQLIAARVPHELVIVGRQEGFLTADEAVHRESLALGDRVRFTGELPFEKLRALVAHADGLVLPSLYEGFGLPPLEAMSLGCPTLVSRVGALPEVCADASLYCDPTDPGDVAEQLHRLLSDDALREQLRRAGYARSATFTWSRCVARTLEVIEEVLAR